MIDYDDGSMDIECDECGDQDSTSGSFKDCMDEFKSQGWISIPPQYRCDSWLHFCCPECKQKYLAYRNEK